MKALLSSLLGGFFITVLSVFYSSCAGSSSGDNVFGDPAVPYRGDCEYISDAIFHHGFPLSFSRSGGIAGISEFNLYIFLIDVLIWSTVVYLLIFVFQKIRHTNSTKALNL